MKLRLLEETKNSINIELTEFSDTLLYPLMEHLLSNEDVVIATHTRGHPELEKPTLYITTKKGKPRTVLNNAAKAISKDVLSLKKQI